MKISRIIAGAVGIVALASGVALAPASEAAVAHRPYTSPTTVVRQANAEVRHDGYPYRIVSEIVPVKYGHPSWELVANYNYSDATEAVLGINVEGISEHRFQVTEKWARATANFYGLRVHERELSGVVVLRFRGTPTQFLEWYALYLQGISH